MQMLDACSSLNEQWPQLHTFVAFILMIGAITMF